MPTLRYNWLMYFFKAHIAIESLFHRSATITALTALVRICLPGRRWK